VFALTSLAPLGAFVVFHVLDYGRVLLGVQTVGARQAPASWVLAAEALLVWLPLLLHVVLAVPIWRARRRLPNPDPSARALLALHRLAGSLVGAFLLDHFLRFRWPILRGELEPADSVQRLAAELSRTHGGFPWIAALHLCGMIAVAFHLGYGLHRIAARSPRWAASGFVRGASLGLGLLLLFTGLFALVELAAG
jgi:hypothetical protein